MGCGSVIKHMLGMHKAMGSILSTPKRKDNLILSNCDMRYYECVLTSKPCQTFDFASSAINVTNVSGHKSPETWMIRKERKILQRIGKGKRKKLS